MPLEERQEKPWEQDPYHDDSDWYRDDLYDGMFESANPADLKSLAVEWLEELAREGYRGRVAFYDYKSGRHFNFSAKQKTISITAARGSR